MFYRVDRSDFMRRFSNMRVHFLNRVLSLLPLHLLVVVVLLLLQLYFYYYDHDDDGYDCYYYY